MISSCELTTLENLTLRQCQALTISDHIFTLSNSRLSDVVLERLFLDSGVTMAVFCLGMQLLEIIWRHLLDRYIMSTLNNNTVSRRKYFSSSTSYTPSPGFKWNKSLFSRILLFFFLHFLYILDMFFFHSLALFPSIKFLFTHINFTPIVDF